MEEAPKGWDSNKIASFFDRARGNQFATFANEPGIFARYSDIDEGFRLVQENVLHRSAHWFSGFFILRSHSAFLGACQLVSGGQVVEAYALNRVVIEQALYGIFLAQRPELREVWLNRHDSRAAKAAVRTQFRISAMLDVLRNLDQTEADVAEQLYERTIDHGAHPNERALMQGMAHVEDGGDLHFEMSYLFPEGAVLDACRKTTAQCGVCALAMYRPLFRERYDILDITGLLDHLKRDL
ncbi:hypothetical protein [Paraburkholderia bryophila]|uniref:Uncharacterized protein n=1 Tax=Paraburkholderia bryophila TaxID=420952 RepID=A0A7Y9WK06_9BURK|nr:hypothetical protein [Paraburkholderia bryophila]NYH21720.1 hypothetical protein [Paraburkholderia bryophila]